MAKRPFLDSNGILCPIPFEIPTSGRETIYHFRRPPSSVKKRPLLLFFLETIFLLIILIHLTVWSCRGGLLAGGMRVVEGGLLYLYLSSGLDDITSKHRPHSN